MPTAVKHLVITLTHQMAQFAVEPMLFQVFHVLLKAEPLPRGTTWTVTGNEQDTWHDGERSDGEFTRSVPGQILRPMACQNGLFAEKRISSRPASVIMDRISSLVNRCSKGVPKRSKASLRITVMLLSW